VQLAVILFLNLVHGHSGEVCGGDCLSDITPTG
jgi:hypothetical protein